MPAHSRRACRTVSISFSQSAAKGIRIRVARPGRPPLSNTPFSTAIAARSRSLNSSQFTATVKTAAKRVAA
jgi:hypothetical protein